MTRKPKVVILDDFERAVLQHGDWDSIKARVDLKVHVASLRGPALLEATREADVLVLVRDRTPVTAELVSAMPNLRYLMHTGPRNLKVDLHALAARAVPVSYTEMSHSKVSTAELCWAMIMAASKQVVGQHALVQQGGWRDDKSVLPVLRGQRLGLIGFGNIGQLVATYANAFGMEIVTWSPNMTAARAEEHGAKFVSLDELLQSSKVVSLHIVVSPSTKGLLNQTRLGLMRRDSVLVNTSRAELINTADLAAHMAQGTGPGIAGLDVHEEEPLPANHLLKGLPNVLLTPHLGFIAEPNLQQCSEGLVENLRAWLEDEPLPRLLKTPALKL